jgi:hypothetical protein
LARKYVTMAAINHSAITRKYPLYNPT